MLALMLERGINVDDAHPDEGNTLGSTALHNTSRQGDIDGVRLLLAHGADGSIKNELGETPLDVAKNDKVRALVARGHWS